MKRQPTLIQHYSASKANAILAAVLILVFSYAALSKAVSLEQFMHQLALQPFSRGVALTMAYLLPALELAAAVLLAARRTLVVGWWLSFILMSAFTAYSLLVVAGFWPQAPCPCGGILGNLPWSAHLAFNVLLLAVTITGILTYKERRNGDP
jgi:hypothetical protein